MDNRNDVYRYGEHVVVWPRGAPYLKIFDPVGHWIWNCLQRGIDAPAVADMLSQRFGLEAHGAQAWVRQVADTPAAPVPSSRGDVSLAGPGEAQSVLIGRCDDAGFSFNLSLGGALIRLATNDELVAESILRMYGHLLVAAARRDCQSPFLVRRVEDAYRIEGVEGSIECATFDDCLSSVHFLVVEAACAARDTLAVLHASAVSRMDLGIILMGPGGAGKSTLAGILAGADYTYLCDDVVPIDAHDGSLVPVPVPQCVKHGSWPMLDAGDDHPTHVRLGRRTRYCLPPAWSVNGPKRYFLLEVAYNAEGPDAELAPLTAEQRLALMARSESLRLPSLTRRRFQELIDWVHDLAAWRLEYRDAHRAKARIERLVSMVRTRALNADAVRYPDVVATDGVRADFEPIGIPASSTAVASMDLHASCSDRTNQRLDGVTR